MITKAYSRMNRTKWAKQNNRDSLLMKTFVLSWCIGLVILVYHHHASSDDQFVFRMKDFENKVKDAHKAQPVTDHKIILPASCGSTENTYVNYYGAAFNPPLTDLPTFGDTETIYNAYGCSNHAKYCVGEPKAIPCCTKIMFDIWHAADKYLAKYNVTYSFRWGSLLFAVRNGAHMPWDNRDIDLGFAFPADKAFKALKELVNDFGIKFRGDQHLTDTHVFYKLHHEKYGYPDPTQKMCFVNVEYDGGYQEYCNEDTLTLASSKQMFVDFGVGDEGSGGIDLSMSHGKPMIPVDYDGPNGMKPPRQMYVYPDFYNQLNREYGNDNWDWARNMIPPWISDDQLQYHGMSKVNNRKYWEKFQRRMMRILGKNDSFVIELLSNVN